VEREACNELAARACSVFLFLNSSMNGNASKIVYEQVNETIDNIQIRIIHEYDSGVNSPSPEKKNRTKGIIWSG